MKTESLKRSITRSEGFWAKAQRFYNAMPIGISECKSEKDAKMYTVVLLTVMSALCILFVIPCVAVYYSAMKGEES